MVSVIYVHFLIKKKPTEKEDYTIKMNIFDRYYYIFLTEGNKDLNDACQISIPK